MLVLKLVGNVNIEYRIDIGEDEFSLNDVLTVLENKGIETKYLDKIKYIYKGVYITDTNILHPIENQCLFLFTQDMIIRDELIKHFQKVSVDSPPPYEEDIVPNLPDTVDEIPCDIDIINKQIITQFQDPDFCNLLRIALVKPQLIGLVNSYLMNGNISEKIQITDCSDFQYDDEYNKLDNLGFLTNDVNMTKSILTHFKGHLNMSIRYILWLNHKNTE